MLNEWSKIKNEIFAKEGHHCWICGAQNTRLEAHEWWEYDDVNKIQRLKDIHHICGMCHKVKHIGLWLHTKDGSVMLKNAGLTKQDIINHFCKVNDCSVDDFRKHESEAFKVFQERSKYEWKQDFGIFNNLIKPLIKK